MTWVSENLAVVLPFIVCIAGGIGYLLDRVISGKSHIEDQESLERTIRLHKLLQTEGLSLHEAKKMRDEFRRGHGNLLAAEAKTVVQKHVAAQDQGEKLGNPDNEAPLNIDTPIPFEETTAGMRVKAASELEALDAQLHYAVHELAHDLTDARAASLHETQERWFKWRETEAEFAALLFEGGTGAPLLGTARMIELTEQRLRDLALAKAEADL